MNARRGLAVAVIAAVAMASACSRSHGCHDSATVLVAAAGDQLVGREWLLEGRRDTLTQGVMRQTP